MDGRGTVARRLVVLLISCRIHNPLFGGALKTDRRKASIATGVAVQPAGCLDEMTFCRAYCWEIPWEDAIGCGCIDWCVSPGLYDVIRAMTLPHPHPGQWKSFRCWPGDNDPLLFPFPPPMIHIGRLAVRPFSVNEQTHEE